MLRVERGMVVLKGKPGARIFRRGFDPVEAADGDRLEKYLGGGTLL